MAYMERKACLPLLLLLVLVLSLSGCGMWKDYQLQKQKVRNAPEAHYHRGIEAFQDGRYKRAIESFTRVKEQFPLDPLALLAELGIADANFSDGQFAEADLAYTDFLSLHPTNENIPYVMYQIGLCHYNQILSIDRDQSDTLRALGDFERLIARYPTSKFAFMAEKKVHECRQKLAEKEFYIGEFYFKRERYKAAIQRFEALAKNYPTLGFDYQNGIYLAEARKRLAVEEAKKAKGETIKKKEGSENRITGGW
jgi:outer membrane protein assembly factor BamD